MARSNLDFKFTVNNVAKWERKLKDAYKKEEGKPFKGNIIYTKILEQTQQGIPDLDFTIEFTQVGNNWCEEQQACDILTRWLESEEGQRRGLSGAFQELAKDYCLDIPTNEIFKEQINNLENTMNDIVNMRVQMMNMITKLKDLTKNIESKVEGITDEKVEEVETVEDDVSIVEDTQ